MSRWAPLLIILATAVGGCAAGNTPEARGEALVNDLGCVACHADATNSLGPTWNGVAGAERSLEDGRTVVADEVYLRESIVDPAAAVLAGWRPAMPNFYLQDDEIADIVAYLQSLSGDALVPTIASDEE